MLTLVHEKVICRIDNNRSSHHCVLFLRERKRALHRPTLADTSRFK
jgi:hypothetical protein